MITGEQILKNTEKYFKTAEAHGFMNDELLDFLGQDFVKAPASTGTAYNNAFEGGLIAHLLKTTKYAISINNVLPEALRVDQSSLIKVSLLHQIGKAKMFIAKDPASAKWHIDRGMLYDFNEEITSLRVGERSTIYALSNGIELTEDEFQAIINHDKDDSDKQAKYYSSTLSVILRQANELAILEEKTTK